MHRTDKRTGVLGFYFRGNTMAQVEHMARAVAVAGQDALDFGADGLRVGVQHGRVHVALQGNLVADTTAGFTEPLASRTAPFT